MYNTLTNRQIEGVETSRQFLYLPTAGHSLFPACNVFEKGGKQKIG